MRLKKKKKFFLGKIEMAENLGEMETWLLRRKAPGNRLVGIQLQLS